MNNMDGKSLKIDTVHLRREQLQAILDGTKGPVVTIEQTKGEFTHTYATDKYLERQGRLIHVSLPGRVTECERRVGHG